MTLADYSLAAFAVLNGGRAVAYFPQLIRVYRDPDGAAAVSVSTWALFAAANIATVCYALTVSNDRTVALLFGLNAVGCLAIAGLTALKRVHMVQPRSEPCSALHRIETLQHSQQLVASDVLSGRFEVDYSPTARVRDEMIRQGLMS